LPARVRDNEWAVVRAAGQLSSRPLGIGNVGQRGYHIAIGRTNPMVRKSLNEGRSITHYWWLVLRKAVPTSIRTWLLLFVVAGLPQLISFLLTRLQAPGTPANAFIPPNYLLSLVVLLAAILLYRLITIPPIIHRDLEARANKFTWSGVAVDLVQSGPHSPHGLCLRLHNGRSFPLDSLGIVIAAIQVDRKPLPGAHSILPYTLAWIQRESLDWQPATVSAGEDAHAALANLDERRASAFYVTPSTFGISINANTDHVVRIRITGQAEAYPLPPMHKIIHLRYDGKLLASEFLESGDKDVADA